MPVPGEGTHFVMSSGLEMDSATWSIWDFRIFAVGYFGGKRVQNRPRTIW